MKLKIIFPIAAVVLAFAVSAINVSIAAAADKFMIDKSHSSVEFAVSHMVVSKVKGNFDDFTGTILYDQADVTKSSIDVNIKTASINTRDEKRDDHLRNPDFFDAESFPEITFKSNRVEKSKDGFVAIGDLTMRGVTKEVSMPFSVAGVIADPWGNTRMGASATLTIDRQDYDVSFSKKLDNGGLVVGDNVDIEIEIEAIMEK